MVEYISTLPVGVPKPYSSPVCGSVSSCHLSGEGQNTGLPTVSADLTPSGSTMKSFASSESFHGQYFSNSSFSNVPSARERQNA